MSLAISGSVRNVMSSGGVDGKSGDEVHSYVSSDALSSSKDSGSFAWNDARSSIALGSKGCSSELYLKFRVVSDRVL